MDATQTALYIAIGLMGLLLLCVGLYVCGWFIFIKNCLQSCGECLKTTYYCICSRRKSGYNRQTSGG